MNPFRMIIICIASMFFFSCNRVLNDKPILVTTTENDKLDTVIQKERLIDTCKNQIEIFDTVSVNNNINNHMDEPPIEYTRFLQFPSDVNWNGKPLVQQVELCSTVLNYNPDTLSNLALMRYKTYDSYFPIAISDNFEEGISTEIIMYPEKLIFQFHVFENEYAAEPYLIKNISVMRNANGDAYVE